MLLELANACYRNKSLVEMLSNEIFESPVFLAIIKSRKPTLTILHDFPYHLKEFEESGVSGIVNTPWGLLWS